MTKILAIDDIESNLFLIKTILTKFINECEVFTARSAKEGIKIANIEKPDTIILDINMPQINGFDACRIIKRDPNISHIPIVIVTSIKNDPNSVVKALSYGADAFISKPIGGKELAEKVKVALRIKKAEDRLKRETERYRIMTNTLPDAVITINLDGKITYASPKAAELYGFISNEELVGENILSTVLPKQHKKAKNILGLVHKRKIVKEVNISCVRNDGSVFSGEISASLIKNKDDEPSEFILIIRDITNRQENEKSILNYQKKLKRLNYQLTSVEEKERRKIAINLHDYLGQSLSIAHIKMSSLSNYEFEPKVKNIIKESTELIRSAIKESRSLTYEISPPILFESGFFAALKWRLEQIQEKYGIAHEFNFNKNEIIFDNEQSVLLYRIICELLMNVIKHADASCITIDMRKIKNKIYINVKDNGRGFEYTSDPNLFKNQGFGLFSISERLESIMGNLLIDSEVGNGTKATLIIPVKN